MQADLHSDGSQTGTVSEQVFAVADAASAIPQDSRSTELGPQRLFRYRYLKRAIDIFLILLFSPVLLLALLTIAIAVRIGSPGPIFFTHRRIRRHGAFFSMWKFRTMCVNSTEVLEAHLAANPDARAEWLKTHKLRSDPRITPVGLFLRKTSLDELPQVWNVLTGSMSLVGPRPIVAAEVEKYGSYFTDYCRVKPGVTGLWQVSGRSKTTYDERVQLDRDYAGNWSLRGDIVILVKTLWSVVNQDGAY
jgi:Undecaprenyl-phosphate galactose phosphotransferase WbaP